MSIRTKHFTIEEWTRKKGYNLKQFSEFEKGWLAAAIDGEGSIAPRPYQRVMIWNTSTSFLEFAKLACGCGKIREVPVRKIWKNQKKTYSFEVVRIPEVFNLLKQVEPFLVIKRHLAQAIISDLEGGVTVAWVINPQTGMFGMGEKSSAYDDRRRKESKTLSK